MQYKSKNFINLIVLMALLYRAQGCPNEINCRECGLDSDNNKVCVFCENSYFDLSTKKCQANIKEKISNCISYEKVGEIVQCKICQIGFALSLDGTCLPCNSKLCAICNINGECLACKDGARLKDGFCDSQLKCRDSNCGICKETSKSAICTLCQKDYMRVENGMCLKGIANCEVGDSKSNTCVKCADSYYITDTGKCSNYVNSGLGILFWIFIIVCIAAIGYLSYYYLVLRKSDRGEVVSEEGYVSINE